MKLIRFLATVWNLYQLFFSFFKPNYCGPHPATGDVVITSLPGDGASSRFRRPVQSLSPVCIQTNRSYVYKRGVAGRLPCQEEFPALNPDILFKTKVSVTHLQTVARVTPILVTASKPFFLNALHTILEKESRVGRPRFNSWQGQ
jgi:hypothetical protein